MASDLGRDVIGFSGLKCKTVTEEDSIEWEIQIEIENGEKAVCLACLAYAISVQGNSQNWLRKRGNVPCNLRHVKREKENGDV